MTRYLKRLLLPDETVLYTARLHGSIYRFGIVLLVAGALIGHFGYWVASLALDAASADVTKTPLEIVGVTVAVIGALDVLFTFIRQISTEIVVTNQRIISKSGLFATKICEAMMARVTSVNIDQSVSGRLHDYGTVSVVASGGDIAPVDHVAHPYAFYSCVMRAQREAIVPHIVSVTPSVAKPEDMPQLPSSHQRRAGG